MGTAVIALIAFAVVLGTAFAALGDLVGLSVTSADSLRASWREAERVVDSRVRPTSVTTTVTLVIADVDIVVENTGRLKYAEAGFPDWNVVIRYQDSLGNDRVENFQYSDTIDAGKWTVDAIYADQATLSPEIYEPGIFNPSEEMVIKARLVRLLGVGTVNQATIVPPEGPSRTIYFVN